LERRSIALRASWMARWVIAYMRDSLSGLSTGAMQAVSAAFAADAFQAMTAFDLSGELALAGAAIAAALVSETAKRPTL
jgi:hypothetical protein